MGKPKKRNKQFNYSKNRRRAWKKSKQLPKIGCKQMREAWDEKKSISHNLREMGLSGDPNKSMPPPKTKDQIGPKKESAKQEEKPAPSKLSVVQDMEREANLPQPKRMRLSEPEVRYCIHMMEKYGEDYKAMAKDERNYYQDTPKQIRRKINAFKNIPEQYNAYVKSKAKTDKEMETG